MLKTSFLKFIVKDLKPYNDKVEGKLQLFIDDINLTENIDQDGNFRDHIISDLLMLASFFIEVNFLILNNKKNKMFSIDHDIFKDFPPLNILLLEDCIKISLGKSYFINEGSWLVDYDSFYYSTEKFINKIISNYEIWLFLRQ